MKNTYILLVGVIALGFLSSCEKEKKGCMDSLSYTYDSEATEDDGSCNFYYGGRDFGQIDVGAEVDLENEYDIYVDGYLIGRSTYYFPSGLSCGNSQSVGSIFTSGNHTIRAIGNGGTEVREGTVSLLPQECLVVLIENLAVISSTPDEESNSSDVTFWLNEDLGCGMIYVTLASIGSGTIDSYYAENPSCGATGCANFTSVPYGTYSFSATSDGGCVWDGSLIVDANCETMKLTLNGGNDGGSDGGGDGGGSNLGDVTFWTNQDLGCGNIYLSLSSYSGTISAYYNGNPGCGAASCANFSGLPYGTYSYSGTSDGGCSWSGTILIDESCETMQLTLDGSGGGGGGGSDIGDVTFWTNQDLGCGNIKVTITSYGSGTITSYYSSAPNCGATGCANFTGLAFGAYSFSATSDGGCTWSGNIQVDSGCELMQLTLANKSAP